MVAVPKTLETMGGFNNSVIATEALDTTTAAVATRYISVGTADYTIRLPSTAGLKVGSKVFFLSAAVEFRIVVECFDRAGANAEQITGEGNAGEAFVAIGGELAEYSFEYIGAGTGDPLWLFVARSNSLAGVFKVPVEWATKAPLPAFTVSGVDENLILTGNANLQLVVDGLTVGGPTGALRGGVLVKDEFGGTQQYNGIWQVVDEGSDAVRPWVLRRRTDWASADHPKLGTSVFVRIPSSGVFEGSNQGKTYTTAPDIQTGYQAVGDFAVNRNRVEDIANEGWGSTSGVSPDILSVIPTLQNGTIVSVRVRTVGQDDTTNEENVYVDELVIKRTTGGTVTVELVDSIVSWEAVGMVPASRGVDYAVNGNNIDVTVPGVATHNIEWRTQWAATYMPLGAG